MTFDLDADGNIKTCPVLGWTTVQAMGMAVLARIEYAETPEQLKTGATQALQIVLTPQQALEIAETLTRQAMNILQGRELPSGNA
jgi:hypothetical protein